MPALAPCHKKRYTFSVMQNSVMEKLASFEVPVGVKLFVGSFLYKEQDRDSIANIQSINPMLLIGALIFDSFQLDNNLKKRF
jgi:hypothetical protein